MLKVNPLLAVLKEELDGHGVVCIVFGIFLIPVVFVGAGGLAKEGHIAGAAEGVAATRTASAMSFPSPSAIARAAALMPAASARERPGLLPDDDGPRSSSKRIADLSAKAKASSNSLFPGAGLGGGAGGERFIPTAGNWAEGIIIFSMRASITEKRDKFSEAKDLLTSETEGSSSAVLTAATLLLASTIRARTPATSRVKGGGRSEGGEVAGDVIQRLFAVASAHSLCGGVRAGAA